MNDFWTAILGGVASGTVIAAVISALTAKAVALNKSEVEDAFKRIVEVRYSRRALLEEVLGPVCAHLKRTGIAFSRWDPRNLGLETEIIRNSNLQIRDTLLAKYHLLTPQLRQAASQLIAHYDMWLEEYERVRGEGSTTAPDFVFVGPAGYPFPKSAEKAFTDALESTYEELTMVPVVGSGSDNQAGSKAQRKSPSSGSSIDFGQRKAPR